MNSENNEIEDVFEVLPAERTEIQDYSDLRRMVEEQGYYKCVVRKRIVLKDEEGKERS